MGAARRVAIRRLWVRVLGILRCGREASWLLPGPATTWPGPRHDQRRLPRLDSANHDDDQRGQPRHPGPAQGQAEHSNRAFAGQVVQRSDDQRDAPEDDRRDQGQEEHRPTDSGYSCRSSCSVHGPPFPGPGGRGPVTSPRCWYVCDVLPARADDKRQPAEKGSRAD